MNLDERREARAARGELEDLLGVRVSDWPWSVRVSWSVDCLLAIEETAA
jgi:hypothetical protein